MSPFSNDTRMVLVLVIDLANFIQTSSNVRHLFVTVKQFDIYTNIKFQYPTNVITIPDQFYQSDLKSFSHSCILFALVQLFPEHHSSL